MIQIIRCHDNGLTTSKTSINQDGYLGDEDAAVLVRHLHLAPGPLPKARSNCAEQHKVHGPDTCAAQPTTDGGSTFIVTREGRHDLAERNSTLMAPRRSCWVVRDGVSSEQGRVGGHQPHQARQRSTSA